MCAMFTWECIVCVFMNDEVAHSWARPSCDKQIGQLFKRNSCWTIVTDNESYRYHLNYVASDNVLLGTCKYAWWSVRCRCYSIVFEIYFSNVKHLGKNFKTSSWFFRIMLLLSTIKMYKLNKNIILCENIYGPPYNVHIPVLSQHCGI